MALKKSAARAADFFIQPQRHTLSACATSELTLLFFSVSSAFIKGLARYFPRKLLIYARVIGGKMMR